VVDLPSNRTAALLAIEQLEQQGFVDRATRAVLVDLSNHSPNPNPNPSPSPNPHPDQVFVDLSAFNANVGMFYSARILFEFLPSGGIVHSRASNPCPNPSPCTPNPNPSPHPHPNPSPNPHADQVFVDLSAFNANVGMFYSARILFEFLPSGGIVPRRPSNPCPSPSPSTPNPDPNPQP